MPGINLLAVVVAAVAAFIVSTVWYIIFAKELAKVSPNFADMKSAPNWKKIAVIVQSFVIAFVLAYVIGLTGTTGWIGAVSLAIWLWVGFSAMQWVGSMLWENVPPMLAAIHGGDWLVKLIVIAIIVGVWR